MTDLEKAKELISGGDKEQAIRQLASLLIKNRDEVEAWLLLGELIEDPARKKDCYRQVLRLSPFSVQAMTKLQELEAPPPDPVEIADVRDVPPGDQAPVRETKPPQNHIQRRNPYPPIGGPRDGPEIIGYVIGGIAAFLVIFYVIGGTGRSSNDTNTLYLGLIFLSLVAGIIILSVSSKNRG